MKKLSIASLTAFTYLSSTVSVFAQGQGIDITIDPPEQGIDPSAEPGKVFSNVITIIFIVAALLVLFFIIAGAFRWITSGGDKEAIGKARGTIINALIGLALLALAFLIVRVVGGIVNVDILNGFHLPALDEGAVLP